MEHGRFAILEKRFDSTHVIGGWHLEQAEPERLCTRRASAVVHRVSSGNFDPLRACARHEPSPSLYETSVGESLGSLEPAGKGMVRDNLGSHGMNPSTDGSEKRARHLELRDDPRLGKTAKAAEARHSAAPHHT